MASRISRLTVANFRATSIGCVPGRNQHISDVAAAENCAVASACHSRAQNHTFSLPRLLWRQEHLGSQRTLQSLARYRQARPGLAQHRQPLVRGRCAVPKAHNMKHDLFSILRWTLSRAQYRAMGSLWQALAQYGTPSARARLSAFAYHSNSSRKRPTRRTCAGSRDVPSSSN